MRIVSPHLQKLRWKMEVGSSVGFARVAAGEDIYGLLGASIGEEDGLLFLKMDGFALAKEARLTPFAQLEIALDRHEDLFVARTWTDLAAFLGRGKLAIDEIAGMGLKNPHT